MSNIHTPDKMMQAPEKLLTECASMLEKYVDCFPKERNSVTMSADDRKLWLEKFRPALVDGGPQLPDNIFFEPTGQHKNYGIGDDASFTCQELFQFLYRIYPQPLRDSLCATTHNSKCITVKSITLSRQSD